MVIERSATPYRLGERRLLSDLRPRGWATAYPGDPAATYIADVADRNVAAVRRPAFGYTLLAFTALIWLDSAAFFIIQNSPALKAGTWQGTLHLWQNGAIHLGAALASVWLLRHRGLLFTLLAAFACIATAGMLLHHPERASLASVFYPAGVSLYSVALVAYPSLLLGSPSDAVPELLRHMSRSRREGTHRWGDRLQPSPLNLFSGDLRDLPGGRPLPQQTLTLERIVKFGVPGTTMPGHEYLPDAEVMGLANWLLTMRAHPCL